MNSQRRLILHKFGQSFPRCKRNKIMVTTTKMNQKNPNKCIKIGNNGWHFSVLPDAWVQQTSPNICFDLYLSIVEFSSAILTESYWVWIESIVSSLFLYHFNIDLNLDCRFSVNTIVMLQYTTLLSCHDIKILRVFYSNILKLTGTCQAWTSFSKHLKLHACLKLTIWLA